MKMQMKDLFDQILVVEDDEVAVFLTENLLRDLQVSDSIRAVTSAELALDFIENSWLSSEKSSKQMNKLLLLDIHLENWDGFDLLEQLEKLPSIENLCVVILSVSLHPRYKEKAERFKVDALIEKPLTREKLETVADKLKACSETT